MSMLVLLPTAIDGLRGVEKALRLETLDRTVSALASAWVAVSLPRFEVNPAESLALKPVLQAMGMPLAFDRQRADFTGIANPKDPHDRLSIGDVFHKAFVKMDEKGTEAAAVAVAECLEFEGGMRPAITFRADHPFLFLIRDNESGVVLFMGRVADPQAH